MIPFNLGHCLLNTGSNIDAIEAFKIAIKLDDHFFQHGETGIALVIKLTSRSPTSYKSS